MRNNALYIIKKNNLPTHLTYFMNSLLIFRACYAIFLNLPISSHLILDWIDFSSEMILYRFKPARSINISVI